jgi:glycopeptide antibiotics resistance protein
VKPASRRTLWLLYAAFILYGGTIPFHFAGDADLVAARWHRLLANPLLSPETGRRLSIPDVVQNVLLFVPFGVLGVAAAGNLTRWTWKRIVWVAILGAALSATVEGCQLTMRNRVAALSDLVFNTAGALAGGVAARWGGRIANAGLARLRSEGLADVPELRTMAIAAVLLAIAFLQPFDVTLEVGTVVGHMRALQANPWQLSVPRDEGIVILIASLFSMSLASYLWALGEPRAGRKAAAIGIVVVCALEGAQVVIGSRMPGLWDAAVGSTGVLVGAAIWTTSSRVDWPRLWQGVLIAMTVTAAAMQMLSPFELADEYRGFGWFLFRGYYLRTTFEALSHAIELSLAYFPLGFCLALAAGATRRALWLALALTLAIAAPIEYLQGWVVGRYPDVSDLCLSLLGAWAGWLLAQTDGRPTTESYGAWAARDKSRPSKGQ